MSAQELAPDLGGQVRRGLAWSTVSNLMLRGGSLAVGIALARLLTPSEFGVFAVALTVQAVLITLADLGLSADLIRTKDPESRAPTVGALGLGSGALLATVMVLTSGDLASLLGSPDSAHAIAALAVTVVLAGAGVVPYAMLQREFRQKEIFAIAAADLVVSTALTMSLVLAGWGVMALAVGRIAGQSVTLVMQFILSGTRPHYAVDRRVAASVLRFGAPIAAANMLSWVLLNVDTVVVARLAGPTLLGFYVLAFNISSWPMTAIGQVVRSVALPAFSRLDSREKDPGLALGVGLAWALALPAGAALAALASPLVLFVYGARWEAAVPVLVALGFFGTFRVLFDLFVAFLLACGRSGPVLCIQGLWLVALVPVMIAATNAWGIAGTGYAHVLVAIFVTGPAYLYAVRRAGVDLRTLVGPLVLPLLAAVPAAALGGLAAATIDRAWLALVVGGLSGGLVYATLIGRWVRRLLAQTRRAAAAEDESLDGALA